MSLWVGLALGIIGVIYFYGAYLTWRLTFGLPYMLDVSMSVSIVKLCKEFFKEMTWHLPWLGARKRIAFLKRFNNVETQTPDRTMRQLRWNYEKTHRSSENISEKRLWEAYAKFLFQENGWKFWFESVIIPILWPFVSLWVLIVHSIRYRQK